MASREFSDDQTNTANRRIALTWAYLKVVCRRWPHKMVTDAQAVEMWRHRQCVRNLTGKCPLLIFGRQFADELNEFFAHEEGSRDVF